MVPNISAEKLDEPSCFFKLERVAAYVIFSLTLIIQSINHHNNQINHYYTIINYHSDNNNLLLLLLLLFLLFFILMILFFLNISFIIIKTINIITYYSLLLLVIIDGYYWLYLGLVGNVAHEEVLVAARALLVLAEENVSWHCWLQVVWHFV